MRGRVELSRTHVMLERALALVGAGLVVGVLINRPTSVPGAFTVFAVMMGIVVWLPWLARRRWASIGSIDVEDGALAVHARIRRAIPLGDVTGVRAVAGLRAGSVLVATRNDGLVAIDVDDAADAANLAAQIRKATGVDSTIPVRHSRWPGVVWAFRLAASLLALLYYLHVVAKVIPGDKALFGLSALSSGVVLLALHWVRHTQVGPLFEQAQASSSDHSASMLNHLRGHFVYEALSSPVEREPLLDEHDVPATWLTEMRALLAEQDTYRAGSSGHRQRLEAAVASPATPLAQRALALRVLAHDDVLPVGERIDTLPDDLAHEAAWLEEVATLEDDRRALQILEGRVPKLRVGD